MCVFFTLLDYIEQNRISIQGHSFVAPMILTRFTFALTIFYFFLINTVLICFGYFDFIPMDVKLILCMIRLRTSFYLMKELAKFFKNNYGMNINKCICSSFLFKNHDISSIVFQFCQNI